ncbi:hypothetical protein HA402_003696 [Bradysia odoriphaga]|nr:hypothetical protein HA402_003696 [Bradysia odoriphaga]
MLGALILQVMDKEDVESLKVMIFLIEGCLPAGYFNGSLGGLQADMAVFRDLLSARLPKLAKHLQKLQGPMGEGSFEPPLTNVFTMQWFLTLFCTCLPINCVLRVWDLVLIEGSDILLRTALAIWGLLEERILATKTADDFYCKMGMLSGELLNGHLFDSNGLIQKVVDLGPIPELQKLRDKHLYNIAPWRDKCGLKIFLSDDDGDSDDDSKLAVTAAWGIRLGRRGSIGLPTTSKQSDGKDRIALDISLLKKQYDKLRERQRQAHIILTNTAKQTVNSSGSNPISVNQYLMGRNAIVSKGKRLGPLQGSIPPARKPSISSKAMKISPKQAHRDETDSSDKKKPKKNVALDSLESQSNYENYSPKKSSSATSIKSSISDTSLSTPSKSRKRSESSSYSEDSDVNSSTSTSLCDDENFEYSLSSLESSPLKLVYNVKESQPSIDECIRSLNLYKTDDDLENGCDEVIAIYDPNDEPAEIEPCVNDEFDRIINQTDEANEPLSVLEFDKKNYDDILYGACCSKTDDMSESFSNTSDSVRKKYSKKYEEELFGRSLSPTLTTQLSSQLDKNEVTTIKSTSESLDTLSNQTLDDSDILIKQEVHIDNPVGITSTSQLSPIVDISKYLGNFTISPLRTPSSSFLEYSSSDSIHQTNTKSNDESVFQKYLVNDEGVTNEYFEIVNAPERPTRLDLTQSFSGRPISPDDANIPSSPYTIDEANNKISSTEIVGEPMVHYNAYNIHENVPISTSNSSIRIKEFPDRTNFIKEKSYSLDECTKDKEEFRPTSCPESRCDKNNTDRISKIIEENSLILCRILQKKLAGDKSDPTDASGTTVELVHVNDDIVDSSTPFDDVPTSVVYKAMNTENHEKIVIDYAVSADGSAEVSFQADNDKINAIVPNEPTSLNDNKKDNSDEKIVDDDDVAKSAGENTSLTEATTDSDVLKYGGLHIPLSEPKISKLDQSYSNSNKDSSLKETKDIFETLSSIKNTIQNIDSLCQDERRSKSPYNNRKDVSYTTNYGSNSATEVHSTKKMSYDFTKTDYLPSRYSRDRSRDVSPRRRLQEDDKKEYESRTRRDLPMSLPPKDTFNSVDASAESKTKDYSSYIPNLTFSLSNYSPVKSNKFEIRHTTVTSTFYDRFLSQKKERSTKLDKSPSTPVITRTYLESLRPPSKDRNSKSAENSPSRTGTITDDSLLLNAYSPPFSSSSVRSCDNIPAKLIKSSDLRSSFHHHSPTPASSSVFFQS